MYLKQETYAVKDICAVLGLARSSFYHQPEHADEAALIVAIQVLAGEYPTYGYRRITAMLKRQSWTVNHKHIRRLMHELGLQGQVKQRKIRTTNSQHDFGRYPNLVKDLTITRPEQVWVADITYVQLQREVVYLAVIMDVFTRAIRGWHLGRSLAQELTLTALRKALTTHLPEIHHSDQGMQYAATAYTNLLDAHQVAISMTEVGKPEDNGYAERLMRTIKEEAVDLSEYHDYWDAYRQIGHFLEDVYTRKRIHSSLGYLTPVEFEAQWSCQQAAALFN